MSLSGGTSLNDQPHQSAQILYSSPFSGSPSCVGMLVLLKATGTPEAAVVVAEDGATPSRPEYPVAVVEKWEGVGRLRMILAERWMGERYAVDLASAHERHAAACKVGTRSSSSYLGAASCDSNVELPVWTARSEHRNTFPELKASAALAQSSRPSARAPRGNTSARHWSTFSPRQARRCEIATTLLVSQPSSFPKRAPRASSSRRSIRIEGNSSGSARRPRSASANHSACRPSKSCRLSTFANPWLDRPWNPAFDTASTATMPRLLPAILLVLQ